MATSKFIVQGAIAKCGDNRPVILANRLLQDLHPQINTSSGPYKALVERAHLSYTFQMPLKSLFTN